MKFSKIKAVVSYLGTPKTFPSLKKKKEIFSYSVFRFLCSFFPLSTSHTIDSSTTNPFRCHFFFFFCLQKYTTENRCGSQIFPKLFLFPLFSSLLPPPPPLSSTTEKKKLLTPTSVAYKCNKNSATYFHFHLRYESKEIG